MSKNRPAASVIDFVVNSGRQEPLLPSQGPANTVDHRSTLSPSYVLAAGTTRAHGSASRRRAESDRRDREPLAGSRQLVAQKWAPKRGQRGLVEMLLAGRLAMLDVADAVLLPEGRDQFEHQRLTSGNPRRQRAPLSIPLPFGELGIDELPVSLPAFGRTKRAEMKALAEDLDERDVAGSDDDNAAP
jgi:hypothetical protein